MTEVKREAGPGEPDWKERGFWLGHGAPDGKAWCAREMFGYSVGIEKFTAHLLAMAEGLENAYFETHYWNPDEDPIGLYDDDDDRHGMFVIGLRPVDDDDLTVAQREQRHREALEREQLARLKAKYEDPA